MEELNKIMIEKGYKPIFVYKYGVNDATRQQIDNLLIDKNEELLFLKDRYDVLFLPVRDKKLYEDSIEIIDPFFKINSQK